MKVKRFLALVLMAAMLLTACGKQSEVSQTESEPVSESSVSSEESSSEVSSEPEESASAESSEESTPAEEFQLPENAIFALENGLSIYRMFMTPEENLVCMVMKGSGAEREECIQLMDLEGTVLREAPVTSNSILMSAPNGYYLQNWEDAPWEYYTFDLEPCTAAQAGMPDDGYDLGYSEDGKYLELLKPDGTKENIYETGAEDYGDIESHRIQVGQYRMGKYLCYSKYGDAGCYDTETGELKTFYVEGGFHVRGMWNGYLTGHGQGGEGGSYPVNTCLTRYNPETEELVSLALPESVWPDEGLDGRYYAFGCGASERLVELVPGLQGIDLTGRSFIVVFDTESMTAVGYVDSDLGNNVGYIITALDGSAYYTWGSLETDEGWIDCIYRYDLTPIDQPPES